MAGKGNIGRISVTVMPDTSNFRSVLKQKMEAVERQYRARPVKILVEPVLDRKKVVRVRQQIEQAFKDKDLNVKPQINSVALANTKTRLDNLVRTRAARVAPHVNPIEMATARAVLESVVGKDIKLGVDLSRTSVARARAQLFRSNWTKAVDVAFVPGSLDGLERTFFRAFPDMRMWVWPQLDPGGVRELMTRLRTTVDRTRIRVTASWNRGAAARTTTRAATWARALRKRVPERLRIEPAIPAATWAKISTQVAALDAWTHVRSRKIINITMRGAKEAWAFYTRMGVRSFVRWNIQLEITEAARGLRRLASITSTTAKSVAALSAIAMGLVEVLALAGNITTAFRRMAPAVWPLVGIVASFAAGLGVAAVALKDAGEQLEELGPLMGGLQDDISAAFWTNARVPIIENTQRLVAELEDTLADLGGTMGDVFAHMADGLGNRTDEIRGFLENTRTGFAWLAPAMQRFIEGFLRMLEAGSEFFPRFALWMDDLSHRFTGWIDGIEREQGLYNWMNQGWEATKAFGNVLKNFFGLIKDVSELASDAGMSMEEYNDKLVAIRETLASPVMQAGVTGLMTGVREGFQSVSSAIGTVLGRLGMYGQQVGSIVRDVGGIFGEVIEGIGEALINPRVLGAIDTLVGGFGSLVGALMPAVQQMTYNFAPIISQVGDLLTAVAPQVETLGMFLADLAGVTFSNIADLASALLPTVLDVLNNIMPMLIEAADATLPLIIESMADILPILAPIVEELVNGLLDIIVELSPTLMQFSEQIIPPLLEAFGSLLPVIIDLIELALAPLMLVLDVLGPILGAAAEGLSTVLAPAAEGASGALDGLTAAFDWVREKVQAFKDWMNEGSAAAEGIKTALNFLKPVLGAVAGAVIVMSSGVAVFSGVMKLLAPVVKVVTTVFKVMSTVLGALGTVARVLLSGVKMLGGGLKALWIIMRANPLGAIITAITAVVAGLVWFFTQTEVGKRAWQAFVNFLKKVWEGLVRVAKEIWEDITNIFNAVVGGFKSLWSGAQSFFKGLWDGIVSAVNSGKDAIGRAWTAIKNGWDTAWNGIKSFFSGVWDGIVGAVNSGKEAIAGAWEAIKNGWDNVWGSIQSFFSGVWDGIVGAVEEGREAIAGAWQAIQVAWELAWSAMTEFFASTWETITEGFETALTFIQELWETVWTAVSEFVASAWTAIQEGVSAAITAVQDTVSSVLTSIQSKWESTWAAVRDWASSTWETIKTTISDAIGSVRDTISSIMDSVSSAWETGWNAIKTFATDTWDTITTFFSGKITSFVQPFKDMGEGIKNAFKEAFNAIARLWNNTVGQLSFSIPDWVPFGIGGKSWDAPKIPEFAEGGIVTQPTIGLIGEAGDHEAVIPLPRLQPMIDEAVSKSVRGHYSGAEQNTYNVHMNIDAKDLNDLRTLSKFVDMLKIKMRMNQGA